MYRHGFHIVTLKIKILEFLLSWFLFLAWKQGITNNYLVILLISEMIISIYRQTKKVEKNANLCFFFLTKPIPSTYLISRLLVVLKLLNVISISLK